MVHAASCQHAEEESANRPDSGWSTPKYKPRIPRLQPRKTLHISSKGKATDNCFKMGLLKCRQRDARSLSSPHPCPDRLEEEEAFSPKLWRTDQPELCVRTPEGLARPRRSFPALTRCINLSNKSKRSKHES